MPASTKPKRVTKTTTKRRSRATGRSNSRRSNAGISNYASAVRWLTEHTDYERQRVVRYNPTTFNLDRMRQLLEALGNPQKQLQAVHIAGTKGKGSTCHMLESMLRACGYTTGLYTSPHLTDLRERIQIRGEMISPAQLTDWAKELRRKVNRMSDEPTFFEIMTALAFCHFAEQAVDIAILETGLGGRLDSTNVIEPLACGITQISLDHGHILGRTVEKIAEEKAGIFKKGVPAISVEQAPSVRRVLRQAAEATETPLEFTGEDIEFSYRFEANRELGPHTRVCLTTTNSHYEHLAVPLKGEHQALNCGLALALLDKLRGRGFDVPEEKLIQGLAATQLPGRMELVWEEPRILLDGAHNAASLHALIKAIGAHVPYDSLVVIFGCAAEKDVQAMLREVNLGADKIIFTRARSNPRAADPEELLGRFSEVSDKMAQTAPRLSDALNLAARAVSREDLICVTGSFYLVGEARKHLQDLARRRNDQRVPQT